MTTIATDGKTMAGDGLITSRGTVINSASHKVLRLDDGRIIGCCGTGHDAINVCRWLNGFGKQPKVDRLFGAIILHSSGVQWLDDSLLPEPAQAPIAIGSGMDFAIGAMEVGASPKDAVAAAARRDPQTGGRITEETL